MKALLPTQPPSLPLHCPQVTAKQSVSHPASSLIAALPGVCLLLLLAGLAGCSSEASRTERAMYYWRTVFSLPPSVLALLQQSGVGALYVRFFDVDRGPEAPGAVPLGRVTFREAPPRGCEIIPVVYITVRALRNTPPDSAEALARSILAEVDSIASEAKIDFRELQLDCDWTPATRENFFRIAGMLRKEMHGRGGILSATIRLHQIKYPVRTGVPPVDRGMIMFYNMGVMSANPGQHSIYRAKDARRYADFLQSYDLPLDGALPIFYWTLHFRGGRVIGILNKTGESDIRARGGVSDEGNGIFTVRRPVFVRGTFVFTGDVLKVEDVPPELCLAAARQMAGRLRPEPRRIAFFECDSLYLARYDIKDIENIYGTFRSRRLSRRSGYSSRLRLGGRRRSLLLFLRPGDQPRGRIRAFLPQHANIVHGDAERGQHP